MYSPMYVDIKNTPHVFDLPPSLSPYMYLMERGGGMELVIGHGVG